MAIAYPERKINLALLRNELKDPGMRQGVFRTVDELEHHWVRDV